MNETSDSIRVLEKCTNKREQQQRKERRTRTQTETKTLTAILLELRCDDNNEQRIIIGESNNISTSRDFIGWQREIASLFRRTRFFVLRALRGRGRDEVGVDESEFGDGPSWGGECREDCE